MPQNYIFDRPGGGGLSPTIIPPSAGDREEARIRRLMDMAKLHQMQMDPQFEQRRLQLAERGLGLQQEQQTTAKQLGLRGQDIDMRGQDVQMRGQDIGAQANRDEMRQRTLNNIISTAASRPDISPKQWAKVAEEFGFPEVSNSFKAMHEETQNDTAKKMASSLVALKKAGDPEAYGTFLDTIKTNPEAADLTPRILKTAKDMGYDIGPDLDPTKPGVQTQAPTADPQLLAAESRVTARRTADKVESDRLRKLSELFKRRKRAGLEEGNYDPTAPYIVPGYIR